MPFIKFILLTLLFIVFIIKTSDAASFSHNELEVFAKDYLEKTITPPQGGKVEISITNIDPRIIIKPCQQELSANIPEKSSSRNINVKISCNDATPWTMYLPAKIEKTFAVIVAKKTIEKGAMLSTDNIGIRYLARNKMRGKKLSDLNAVLGSKAKKRIGKNKAVSSKSVCLVCKGDVVTIIAESVDFMIKASGTALSDGNINEQISVKNNRSGKVIRPKVSAINQVIIHL